jgi:hypothetical protein
MIGFNPPRRWIRRFLNRLWPGATASTSPVPDQPSDKSNRPFTELVDELESLVVSGDREKSNRLLQHLREQYPIPTVSLLPKEVWETDTDQLVLLTHAALDIEQAVRNVEGTGRTLGPEEKNALERLGIHWCGWSPTSPDHINDSWVWYLRDAYPSLVGLQPILDSLIWSDEISRYPLGHVPRSPWLFLLATKDMYFVYNFQDCTMLEAGNNLMEVVDGMKKERWADDMWNSIQLKGTKEPCDYFPVYDVKHTSEDHPLERPIQKFTHTTMVTALVE